jgi:ankyrin repeat protein
MNSLSTPNRLVQAILNNDVKSVKLILEKSASEKMINYCDMSETPLTLAIQKGNTFIVNALLDHSDIDVNLANKKGMRPIHLLASQASMLKSLDKIINHPKIDIGAFGSKGNVLHYLVESNQVEFLDIILEKNSHINMIDMNQARSLFNIAFNNQNMKMVKKLYELSQIYPKIIRLEDSNQKMDILEQAINVYHVEAVDFILSLNLNSFKKRKHTAIVLAVEHGDLDLIKKLTHSSLGTEKNIQMAINKTAQGSVINQYLTHYLSILNEKSQLEATLHTQLSGSEKKLKL